MIPDPYPVPPFATPAHGSVDLPGSKSITNRALILAALADGETLLENCLFSEDTEIMVKALQDLGFSVQPDPAAKTIRVAGQAGRIPAREASLFVGNSGTSARFLTAFCCLGDGIYTLDGVPQMRRRPIADLAATLNQLGAAIETTGGFAPLTIRARGLRGGEASIDASSSSQFVSALVMAAPYAQEGVRLALKDPSVRRGYIEMTLAMLRQFGVPAEKLSSSETGYAIAPHRPYRAMPTGYAIEGDASAASYFFALPLAVGGEVEIRGVARDSLQGDIAFAQRAAESGAEIEWRERAAVCRFPAGRKQKALRGDFYPYSDTFLTAAAIAPLLQGASKIEGIAHTRHQECDRVAAMANGLRRVGQDVAETEGALEVEPAPLTDARIETYHDHRVAMSFGVLGSFDKNGDGSPWLSIEDPTCCKKTFPAFWDVLEDLRQQSLRHFQRGGARKDFIIVAIDGGAAAGKSSTSRELSARFNLMHVDTGSFYRAVTSKLLELEAPPAEGPELADALASLKLDTAVEENRATIVVNGWIPDASIRSQRINEAVSQYAASPAVRRFLLDYQRSQADFARGRGFAGLVMEGRDIGSVIFPDADLRLFLFADPEKRQRRREAEGIVDSIAERDRRDATRQTAPLAIPEGAQVLDTSEMTLDEVVARVSELVENAFRP